MNLARALALPCLITLACCSTPTTNTVSNATSIGELRKVKIDLTDVRVEASSEKAMQSYQRFLEQTPNAAMTPEALRRLADLKLQREYGTLEGVTRNEKRALQSDARRLEEPAVPTATVTVAAATTELPKPVVASALTKPLPGKKSDTQTKGGKQVKGKNPELAAKKETNQAFEDRATKSLPIKPGAQAQALATPDGATVALQGGAGEAIQLYKKLLARYPNFSRKDQVLYQMTRAYEELGMVEEAMKVMMQISREYARSRYYDEVQFRIGEYHFMRKKFLEAEEAYKSIVDVGPGSAYYEYALYKLGWTFYKQDLYEDALNRFIALLDYKIKSGYDFENPKDTLAHKRIEDTYQVISLSFSNLGGSTAAIAYFDKFGKRTYEPDIYGNLGEYYLEKRRYNDAAVTYKAFVKQNPFHKVAPHFDTRVIDIYKKGGFPKLVIDANKEFVVNYGLKSPYWNHFEQQSYPAVIGYVKASLVELGNHYHALYQDKKHEKNKTENFQEATRWYREFMTSFAKEAETPAINNQMAELLLENKNYEQAAIEFERTAYDFPAHDKAGSAGYAAVYAHRQNLAIATSTAKDKIKTEVIRSSLKFAEAFPTHDKAMLVMSAAVDDVFSLKNYAQAVAVSRQFIERFPQAEQSARRAAWLILAHSSFELENYKEAEDGYSQVLPLTAHNDKTRADLVENLAASIYKQGEHASKEKNFEAAAAHFLRVAKAAPTSTIKPTSDYDGAAALMELKDWDRASEVLNQFRAEYRGHKLQTEVTKKLAHAYREAGKHALAGAEYERIETETKDPELRSAALQVAAELYTEAKETDKALAVYRRYLGYFPRPLDLALEIRFKVAGILKTRGETNAYFGELKQIVSADAAGGKDRTNRTRHLAASSLVTITEPAFEQFAAIKLVKPFDQNLAKKKAGLKIVKDGFESVLRYEIGETTAAATFYLAEMYHLFSRALVESERPEDLSKDEKEQYELALEEQAFPFEEKAIEVHQKNTELIALGVYNTWVDKSFAKLAKLVPARYAKFEESSGFVETFDRAGAIAVLTTPKAPVAQAPTPVPESEKPVAEEVQVELKTLPSAEAVAPTVQEAVTEKIEPTKEEAPTQVEVPKAEIVLPALNPQPKPTAAKPRTPSSDAAKPQKKKPLPASPIR
jgi:cellulose synthase operon protein C